MERGNEKGEGERAERGGKDKHKVGKRRKSSGRKKVGCFFNTVMFV